MLTADTKTTLNNKEDYACHVPTMTREPENWVNVTIQKANA